ncbi:MAG: OmpA family protein [Hyphomicrobiaceae bacterium]
MLAFVSVFLATSPGFAQAPPTAEQIIERLKSGGAAGAEAPARRTRGLSAPGAAPAYPPPQAVSPAAAGAGTLSVPNATPGPDKAAVDKLFTSPRGLSAGDRKQVAVIATERPAIDLTIYFDFNSAEIGPKAVPGLVELGRALSSDTLKGTRFLLAGHTDAKGGDAYNLKLSQRRADAIKRYLVGQFGVDERRLLAIGYGKEQPKNTGNPLADENRRVQVVNFGG